MLLAFTWLLAQGDKAPEAPDAVGDFFRSPLPLLLLVMAIFFFMVIPYAQKMAGGELIVLH